MTHTKGILAGVAAFSMLAVPCMSSAITIEFSNGTPLGKTGSPTYVDSTGLEVHGYYLVNGTTWADAQLFRRNESGDSGFGVCNPVEDAGVGAGADCGGGDVNELDNIDEPEIIALKLPVGYHWVSVGVSSMDDNDPTQQQPPERGKIYSNPDDQFGTTAGSVGATLIANVSGAGASGPPDVDQIIPIQPADKDALYIVFEPYDFVNGTNDDNDFLVLNATIEPNEPDEVDGRMTGGGSVFTSDETRVTHGFEIHCNRAEPNRIQVNWPDHRFHLLELTDAVCTEHENIHQRPRSAPFDTFDGHGNGRLNGVEGATIEFTFIDGGEPGKRHDMAHIMIWNVLGDKVLDVSGLLNKGNHQAHPNNK